MRKTIRLRELDCANCAAKIENAIAKLSGVIGVTVNFMSQKIVLEADDDIFDDVLASAKKAAVKIERDLVFLD